MTIPSEIKRLATSFHRYKQSMTWFSKLQANGLVIFDPKKKEVRLSHRIPEHLVDKSFRAASAYSMTYCYLAKATDYTRKVCIGLFLYIIWHMLFVQ